MAVQNPLKEYLSDAPYGRRAMLGLINVGPNPTPLPDFYRMIPPGVCVNETKIHEEPRVVLDVVGKLGGELAEAARLIGELKPDLVAFTCTAGSMVVGPGYDKHECEVMSEAAGGVPATTTTTACLNAFRFLGAKKLAVGGPYIDEVNQRFKYVLDNSGFEVLAIKGLQIVGMKELASTLPTEAYRIGLEAIQAAPEADAIFIPCTTFRAIDIIDRLEKETGKPVITANQASLWECLRLVGIDDPVNGFGMLLRRPRVGFKGDPR
ncbi:MAG: maleate cis-trans isomerase family protein [Chloroflexota bacterium]